MHRGEDERVHLASESGRPAELRCSRLRRQLLSTLAFEVAHGQCRGLLPSPEVMNNPSPLCEQTEQRGIESVELGAGLAQLLGSQRPGVFGARGGVTSAVVQAPAWTMRSATTRKSILKLPSWIAPRNRSTFCRSTPWSDASERARAETDAVTFPVLPDAPDAVLESAVFFDEDEPVRST